MVLFTLIPLIATTAILKEGVKALDKSFRLVANDNGKKIDLGIAKSPFEANLMKQNFMNQRNIDRISNNIRNNYGGF
jgi:hypothetical protein